MFLVGVGNNICTSLFLDTQNIAFSMHLESKCILYIFLYISVRKCLLQRRKKFLTGVCVCVCVCVGGGWGVLSDLLKTACCQALSKCFKNFYFNLNFWKFNYSSAFRYFHQYIETLKFSRILLCALNIAFNCLHVCSSLSLILY